VAGDCASRLSVDECMARRTRRVTPSSRVCDGRPRRSRERGA
jgi:hypothetical protein